MKNSVIWGEGCEMWVSGDWRAGELFAEAHVLENESSEDVGKSEQRFVHNNGIFIIISAYYLIRSNTVSITCCPAVVSSATSPSLSRLAQQASLAPNRVRA